MSTQEHRPNPSPQAKKEITVAQQEHNNDNAFFPPLFAVLRSITAMYRENRELREKNAALEQQITWLKARGEK